MKKICAIICEFNPFHNGHEYLIKKARESSGCDLILCIMSGHFTQRGDIAVMDKFTRAEHALHGGADCVIELPVHFSVSPAEIFAMGAIKILSSIPAVDSIAFGCENAADLNKIIQNSENSNINTALKKYLAEGNGYAKSYAKAYADCCSECGDVFTPNNILALEYAKAIRKCGCRLKLIPIQRIGGDFNDTKLHDNFSSASAIRQNIGQESIRNNVPGYVFNDLNCTMRDINKWDIIRKYALFAATNDKLKNIYGCTEGLENRLKALERESSEDIIKHATCKRYTSSRIRRILTANALNLLKPETEELLKATGYIKPLAVKHGVKGDILAELARSSCPIVIKQRDLNKLDSPSRKAYEQAQFADKIWSEVYGKDIYNFTIRTV